MSKMEMKKYIISIIAADNQRFLSKLINLIARRCIVVDVLNAVKIQESNLIYINIEIAANSEIINQLIPQFEKMIETIKVQIIEPDSYFKKGD